MRESKKKGVWFCSDWFRWQCVTRVAQKSLTSFEPPCALNSQESHSIPDGRLAAPDHSHARFKLVAIWMGNIVPRLSKPNSAFPPAFSPAAVSAVDQPRKPGRVVSIATRKMAGLRSPEIDKK